MAEFEVAAAAGVPSRRPLSSPADVPATVDVVNRAQRRAVEREQRRALRALGAGDPWARKLYTEAQALSLNGVLDEPTGDVYCPECGERVERADGWQMRFVCVCGWELVELDYDAA